jgi:hypothetical protein
VSTSISIPLDSDGFLRRQCSSCERQFKWRPSDEDDPLELVDQYHCPLCGQPAGPDDWLTDEQIEHAQAAIMPEAIRQLQDMLGDSFRGSKHLKFEASDDRGEMSVPIPLHEPDDMVILEPPCHPSAPVKIPEDAVPPFYCLVCGTPYRA